MTISITSPEAQATAWGPELKISDDVSGQKFRPAIAVDGDKIHIMWTDRRDFPDHDVYYRYFDGTNWQPVMEMSSDSFGESQTEPSIVSGNDTAHAVWIENSAQVNIYYRYFDGTNWQPEQKIYKIDSREYTTSMAKDGNNLHLVWGDGPFGGALDDIHYGHFDGSNWRPEQVISTDIIDEDQSNPEVAAEGGKVHVVWEDLKDGDVDIYYRRFNGVDWEPELELSTDSGTEHQWLPKVAVNGDEVHVAWSDWESGSRVLIYRHFNGTAWEPEVDMSKGIPWFWAEALGGAIVTDGDIVHLLWGNSYDGDIYYWCFDGTNWQHYQKIDTDGSAFLDFHPSAVAEAGKVHVAWGREKELMDHDIYYRSGIVDFMAPESNAYPISPYWHTSSTVNIGWVATDNCDLANVSLHFRFSSDNSSWSDWEDWDYDNTVSGTIATGSFSFLAPYGDGFYEFHTVATDTSWNTEAGAPITDAMAGLDTNPPTGFIVVNNGDAWTDSVTVDLSLIFSDSTSGVSQVRYSNDGLWDTEPWEAPSPAKAWTLSAGDGTKSVYYQIRDNVGWESFTYSDDIILDTTPPTGSTVINGGDEWTTSTSVTLSLTYSDTKSGVYQVRYSNDGVWDTEPWESPTPIKGWTLDGGDGTKTVYHQVLDNAGLESATYSDQIVLDTEPPSGYIIINNGEAQTTSLSVNLTLTYSDATSGVHQARYSNDGLWDTEPWEFPSELKEWNLESGSGTRTVYYQIKDNAGLVSVTYQDGITIAGPSEEYPPEEKPSEESLDVPIAIIVVSAIAITVGAFLYLEWLKYSLLTLFLPLYSRLKRDKVLDHETRGMIRGYVIANPGDHFNAIKKALDLKNGTLAHHLSILEREDFVKSVRDGKYRRFFPFGAQVTDGGRLTKIEMLILEFLEEEPGRTQKDISKRIGISQPSVSFHVNRLKKLDKVRAEKHRMSLRYYVQDSS